MMTDVRVTSFRHETTCFLVAGMMVDALKDGYNSDCLQQSVKHGGGLVMVLSWILASGVGELVGIDAEKYS